MQRIRRTALIAVPLVAAAAVAIGVTPASAATTTQKLSMMSQWSQPTSPSQAAWDGARLDQGSWSSYGFDWSTDYCSASPDQPLGFDFRMPCWRHDFGYRNYKAVGAFPANKSRIDSSFYFDMQARCDTYPSLVQPTCDSLAWTYYQAVVAFGSVAVSQSDLDRAAAMKTQAEAAAAAN